MENIKLTFDPPSALITLNRPEVRNALSSKLIRDFEGALDQVQERADIAALIVTGEGKAFSAGADLQDSQEDDRTVRRCRGV